MIISLFLRNNTVYAVSGARLSGISVSSACFHQRGTYDVELLPPYDVMSWKCRMRGSAGVAYYESVDLNRYCRMNWPGSHADYTDFTNAYSWGCYR